MRAPPRWFVTACVSSLLGAGAALIVQRSVRADGIPTTQPLIYRGFLEENGRPAPDGDRRVEISLWSDATDASDAARACLTPSARVEVRGGHFELALTDACTDAVRTHAGLWVQVRVDDGPPVGDRSRLGAVPYAVEADRASRAAGALEARLAALTARLEAAGGDDPVCPRGYTRDAAVSTVTVCVRTVALGDAGLRDEVVKVGVGREAFWIDRYEASVYDRRGMQQGVGGDYPGIAPNGQWAPGSSQPPLVALSHAGVPPNTTVTWFRANEACRAAGKRLPRADEWLAAAQGTVDSGDNPGTDGVCRTGNGAGGEVGGGARLAGAGVRCASAWGAQDMVGNVWEWTAEWYTSVGSPAGRVLPGAQSWPDGYNADGTWNVSSYARRDDRDIVGLPAAAQRGGSYIEHVRAGVFALSLDSAPTDALANVGFRCVRGD